MKDMDGAGALVDWGLLRSCGLGVDLVGLFWSWVGGDWSGSF